MSKNWEVKSSFLARNTFNPIRKYVESLPAKPNQAKTLIPLNIGDPTIFGNLQPPESAINAVTKATLTCANNGYSPSIGYKKTRDALAKFYSRSGMEFTGNDVILTSGCSGAIEIALTGLVNAGDNILSPMPGFALYSTLLKGLHIDVKLYKLMPERDWEVDIQHMISLIDDRTRAIVIINPSNPCGSVFSRDHLQEILQVAEQFKIPIVADEVYRDMVFSDAAFYPIASLTSTVPILSCGGIAKRFVVPGWRFGWIFIHDRNEIFSKEIRAALHSLSQRILGPNTLIQAAIPEMLKETPQEFYTSVMKVIEGNAHLAYNSLKNIDGLNPIMPKGSMYMMIGIDIERFTGFESDLEFTHKLYEDESVSCIPGRCFSYEGFFRIVLTVPEDMLKVACCRIADFCNAHRYIANGKCH
ncbi:Tyrosine aminotransferase [Trichoplax sp. H2]|uniref:Tyrosine aminotransferase n=1 Tax=Trichoplax adhaerens TaxID=10228 RepID=B3RJH2_TRIAD|nr:expressed hypothetical protein [Trichoplax adhaerens]EDV29819.1 expressed hypothetical protein [Trichoplax adhaerens]RDD40283.1 Tyrosine aminotransferase [Trichoplax sp. H2]|eukprot:XP_002109021.1 expressed hypothetical protein [Trichoplax adhaerens]